jgi:hypothetical protein
MGSPLGPCHADPIAEIAAMSDWLDLATVHQQHQQQSPRSKFGHKKAGPQAYV